MAYTPIGAVIVPQAIADTSTTKKLPLGRMVWAEDPTLGVGEFIYVLASNSVAQYDAVAVKDSFKIAPLTLTNAQTAVEVGFAQIANGVKDTYMWVQKDGRPIVKCALATQPNTALFATATGGTLSSTSSSAMIQGIMAVTQVTNSAGQSTCVARYATIKTRQDAA